jgi:hypothetical protein
MRINGIGGERENSRRILKTKTVKLTTTWEGVQWQKG